MSPLLAFGLPSGGEWFYILLIALVVFGPRKLPELARAIGRSLGEFRKAKDEFEREIQSAANPANGQAASAQPQPPAASPLPASSDTPALLPAACKQADSPQTPSVATQPASNTIARI